MSASIAKLNDILRTTFLTGQVVVTEGIANLNRPQFFCVLQSVRAFDAFTEGDGPYGEHDFGALDVMGVGKVFWKIDYYDTDYTALTPPTRR